MGRVERLPRAVPRGPPGKDRRGHAEQPESERAFGGAVRGSGISRGSPRFEAWPSNYLRYLANAPLSTDAFISQTAFVSSIDAISRWLASHGVDLIFVPVPKMTEVYPEHFIAATPADRIVAPQMRRAIHDLLDKGVEVVDLLPPLPRGEEEGGTVALPVRRSALGVGGAEGRPRRDRQTPAAVPRREEGPGRPASLPFLGGAAGPRGRLGGGGGPGPRAGNEG
ncbi:MAG: hypothetical protein IPP07_13545 [Holophagales bacterium]|nr:hypothetical protein [Holophagales bacterium]